MSRGLRSSFLITAATAYVLVGHPFWSLAARTSEVPSWAMRIRVCT